MSEVPTSAIRARCEAAGLDLAALTETALERMVHQHFDALHKAGVCIEYDKISDRTKRIVSRQLSGHVEVAVTVVSDALLDVNDRLLAEIERLNAVVSAVTWEIDNTMDAPGDVNEAAEGGWTAGTIWLASAVRAALATEVKP